MQKFTRSLFAIGAVLGLVASAAVPAHADTTNPPQHTELLIGASVVVAEVQFDSSGEIQAVSLSSVTIGCDGFVEADAVALAPSPQLRDRVLVESAIARVYNAKGEIGARSIPTDVTNTVADSAVMRGDERSPMESYTPIYLVVVRQPLPTPSGSQNMFADRLADNTNLLHLNL